MSGLEDPGVDGPAHVFDERPEQASVDRPDPGRPLDRSGGRQHGNAAVTVTP
jgi:hypothetical protein